MKKKLIYSFPFKNRIFYRVCFYFGVVIILFTVLIGIVFIRLSKQNSMNVYYRQLKTLAQNVSVEVSQYVKENSTDKYDDYMDALSAIYTTQGVDIWIVSNNSIKTPLQGQYTNVDINTVNVDDKTKEVLESAFDGDTKYISNYDDIYGKVIVHLASPIHDAGGNVIGAVLVNAMVEKQEESLKQSEYFILVSALIALVFSAFIAAYFASQLAKPISRMNRTALKLSEGDYEQKTGVNRKDEIGELAKSIDYLSGRLREAEKMQQNMEQNRRDFFANVSHELRTPITIMRGYAESLADGMVSDPEKVHNFYLRILKECQGMERLVSDLLTLSKVQNPDFELEKEPINLVFLLQDVVRSARILSTKKNITIHLSTNNDNAFMIGDYDRLKQLFLIILTNSIKFSDENSEITIKIFCDEMCHVSVTDFGKGISKEELPLIFEKFFKGNANNENGSGLGLVIAKHITERHAGEIVVESEQGKGSTFKLIFKRTYLEDVDNV